jgi:hypothetical protein
LISGELWAAELSGNFDREFGFGNAGVDASLVGEGGEGDEANVAVDLGHLTLGLLFNRLLEGGDELLGGEAGVFCDAEEVMEFLHGVNLVFPDELVASHEGWGCAGDEEGVVVEGVEPTGVGGFSILK